MRTDSEFFSVDDGDGLSRLRSMKKEELIAAFMALQEKMKYGVRLQERLIQDLEAHQLEIEIQNKELRESQVRLEESRDRYAELFDFAPIVYITLDASGVILDINLTAEALFCIQRSHIVGFPMRQWIDPNEWRKFDEYLRNCRGSGSSMTTDFHFVRVGYSSNLRIDIQLMTVCDHDRSTGAIRYRMMINDISARTEVEQVLREDSKLARQASEMKSQFLANMSHEIRTPLGVISGFSELLLDNDLSLEEREKIVLGIQRNSDHLQAVINEILDLSKVESGRMAIERIQLRLSELFSDIRAVIAAKAKHKKLDFVIKSVGPVPEIFESDPTRLKQILINLVSNAVKFTERGRVEVNVRMQRGVNGTSSLLVFDVSDSGGGIDVAQAEHLFEPFTQADSSMTRKHGGTGLGLTLSRQLARALGGDVVLARSTLGQGSTFTATVDIGSVDQRPLSDLGLESQEGTGYGQHFFDDRSLEHVRVLLVDDSPDNQFLVRRFLEKKGAVVALASDGQEGVRTALTSEYDIVLMDIQMPVLDGYEALGQLRKKGYSQPVIALTAHAMKENRDLCLAKGFDGFLTKPLSARDLESVIMHKLHRH